MVQGETFRELIAAAGQAPSSHNTQPWIFETRGEAIHMVADRTRALPVNDPRDRELVISCGCALLNLRAAAAGRDIGLRVELLPDPADADLMAAAMVEGAAEESLAELARAIPLRHTCRSAFLAHAVPDEVTVALRAAAELEGAWLEPVASAEGRAEVADLVAEGDAIQWADPSWRRELAAWMHPRRSHDGLSLPGIAVPAARLAVRNLDMGQGVGLRDADLAEEAPLLAVLGTGRDGTSDWLKAGQALERVLLTAANAGLQAGYLNQPVQVAHLRPALQGLCETPGQPQVLLRFGHPDGELPGSPRRPVEEILHPR